MGACARRRIRVDAVSAYGAELLHADDALFDGVDLFFFWHIS
jgi:hypothetical protein